MKKLLFLGDSITDAGHLFDEDARALGQGYIRWISKDPHMKNAVLINKGQDGFTSSDILRLLKRDGLPDDLDGLSLLIGVNDLTVSFYAQPDWIPFVFHRNMTRILTLIRSSCPGRLILMEPFLFVPPDIHKHLLPLLSTEHQLLKSLAGDFQAEYLPLQKPLVDAAAAYGQQAVTTDGIHLTDRGNRILADAWMELYLTRT